MSETFLVTGGCGFIGSALVRSLASAGHKVHVVDVLSYAGHRANLRGVEGDWQLSTIDIADGAAIGAVLEETRPEAIFHLAAETHVDRSIDSADAFVRTNVSGTHHLLEATRSFWNALSQPRKDRFRFIHVSTDEVFGSIDAGFVREDAPYAPRSPYAATKASSNHLVRAWHTTYGLPTVTVISSNNYGPRQHPEKLIPTIVRRGIAGDPIPIYGDGENLRDWIYVEDHVAAIRAAFESGNTGESYNVGTMNLASNKEVAHQVCFALDSIRSVAQGTHARQIEFVTDRPGHDRRYAIDTARAQTTLGWEPKTDFHSGLDETVRWYVDNDGWISEVMEGRYDGGRLGLMVGNK